MSMVKDALIAEIQDAIRLSTEYKEKVDTAKTKVKRDTYKKKLKKNNMLVADMVMALDKLNKQDYNTTNNDQ